MNIKFLLVTVAIATMIISCKSNEQTTQSRSQQGQGQRNQRPSIEELFAEMDSNKDNLLSKSEVKGPLAETFSEIDTDDDGFISKTELENAPKPERQGQGGGQRR